MHPTLRGCRASCGSANKKLAAGEPAASSQGRHHNVREDKPGSKFGATPSRQGSSFPVHA